MSRRPVTSSAIGTATTTTPLNLRSGISRPTAKHLTTMLKARSLTKTGASAKTSTASKASAASKTGGSLKSTASQISTNSKTAVSSQPSKTFKTRYPSSPPPVVKTKLSAADKASSIQTRSSPKLGVSKKTFLIKKSVTSSKHGVAKKPSTMPKATSTVSKYRTNTKCSCPQEQSSASKEGFCVSLGASRTSVQYSQATIGLSVSSTVVSNTNSLVVTNHHAPVQVQVSTSVVVTPKPTTSRANSVARRPLLPLPDSPPRQRRMRTRASVGSENLLDTRDNQTIVNNFGERHNAIFPNAARVLDIRSPTPVMEIKKIPSPLPFSPLPQQASKWSDPNCNLFYCPVCLDDILKEGRNIVSTPCGHLFCEECLMSSYLVRPHCPICQEVMPRPFRPTKIFI